MTPRHLVSCMVVAGRLYVYYCTSDDRSLRFLEFQPSAPHRAVNETGDAKESPLCWRRNSDAGHALFVRLEMTTGIVLSKTTDTVSIAP
jgi:hypothetical protein